MRTVYIDKDFKCYTTNDGTMAAIETDFFDGKCNAFVEGYRFIPEGQSWTRADGYVFTGEMITPYKDIRILDAAQKLYEEMQASSEDEEERIAVLEEANAMLMECILEMSEIVYA